MASRFGWLLVALVVVLAAACATPEGPKVSAETARKKGFKPNLPEAPDFQKLVAQPLKASNGAWTVYGVSMNKQALLDQQVEVTGRVKERQVCSGAPNCPERPYVMLEDPVAPRFQLMIVRENDKGFTEFEPGSTATLVGRLLEHTTDGKLFRTEGLLVIAGGVDPEPSPEVVGPDAK
jgi:hypothetical protein